MNPNKMIYLSGPMSGIPEFNFPEFNHWADVLRKAGMSVINPAETAGGETDLPREWFMRMDFHTIMAVDMVLLLPGWENSAGSKAEVVVAAEIGLDVLEIHSYRESFLLVPLTRIDWELSYERGAAT